MDSGQPGRTEQEFTAALVLSEPVTNAVVRARVPDSRLKALDVEDGHRVLEIGTGTGWNAALLTHRLGPANVVTVEVDEDSSRAARTRLTEAGFETLVVVGDGTQGHAPRAPYDG